MKESMKRRTVRQPSGQVATALNIFLGLLVIGVLAVFAWETSRILLAREQLKSCVDIAALSGEASLLSNRQTGTGAQTTAKQTAIKMFQRNSILGGVMSSVTEVGSPTMLSPPAGQAQLYFEFIDPVTGTVGGANSNVLSVTGAYSYNVFGGQFMGIGNTVLTLTTSTKASLPALDVYVVLDISGSMDDQTPVTWIKRYWDPTGGGGVGAPTYSPPTSGPPTSGPIQTTGCAMPNGHPINGLPPQHLDTSQATYAMPCDKCFSEVQAKGYPTARMSPMRGVLNTGAPPGDAPLPPAGGPVGGVTQAGLTTGSPVPPNGYPNMAFSPKKKDLLDPLMLPKPWAMKINSPYKRFDRLPWELSARAQAPPTVPPCAFTHLVVNIDGNNGFGGYSSGGYDFPSVGSLVEASVGNLDSTANANNAMLDLAALGGVTPQSGYKDAYRTFASQRVEPLQSVNSSILALVDKMRYSTDPHFGLVTFSDRAGTSPTDMHNDYEVSWAYPITGPGSFPLPTYHVDPANNHYNDITNVLTSPSAVGPTTNLLVVDGGANTADALREALDHLDPGGPTPTTRSGAARAIILVTDGLPTFNLGGFAFATPPPSNSPAEDDARTQATSRARPAGIPIYVVALSQNSGNDTHLDNIYSDSASGGIAYESGNGAKYYKVPWTGTGSTRQELERVFGNIARQLVNLVK